MADEDTIVVDDTSPTILYFPFADTSGTPDFTAGWNPLFNSTSLGGAPLNVENSTTVHVTSRNDASFLINFQGTGIQLMGSATQAQYQVSVDNNVLQTYSPDPINHILANISGLSNTNHTFILTTKTISNAPRNQTQSFIVFDKAIITSPVPSSNFSLQSLADNTISFFGNWNHSNPASLHQSNTVKDRACASFKGTSLQILGTVLPTGANYSVRLDNITTQSSARTSFTQDNALLFFSGSLDPNTTHTYEITNESGGALILAMGGAKVFASGDPNANASCTPSSPVFPVGAAFKSALSPGTIAALTLAGILGFLVITGMLFFFFVYRPRKKRREFLKRTTRPMPGPSDLILDIAPRFNGQQNDDYVRWKRDVEGASASKDLGIIFRRTPSPKDKSKSSNFDLDGAAENEELSARSFSFSRSSKNGGSKGSRAGSLKSWLSSKKKGSSSSTPSYTIDLPPLRTQNPPPHTPSESRPDLSKTSESHLQPRSSFSGITSLSYLSSSSTASHQFSFNRPGESSPNLHGRTDNHGLLLIDDNVEHLDPSVDNVSVYPATAPHSNKPPKYLSRTSRAHTKSRFKVVRLGINGCRGILAPEPTIEEVCGLTMMG
ncbi:hypothetical protein E1B28_000433 [Marasmius oreades]|uniref:Uncharacterized protein n=1 Tax=Marasmius oreades TaxID=181124 RepID=A0A9P8AED0_9AGAR|nr:uncharacterized protein E1B28_000433 [Marasmius oreades]KAG7098489.1 hypothetical protein E1B28_000433 [Marasmius oreades]